MANGSLFLPGTGPPTDPAFFVYKDVHESSYRRPLSAKAIGNSSTGGRVSLYFHPSYDQGWGS